MLRKLAFCDKDSDFCQLFHGMCVFFPNQIVLVALLYNQIYQSLLMMCTFCIFFLTLYFEIIIDSWKVGKIVWEGPCTFTQFPPKVTCYITYGAIWKPGD